LSGPVWGDYMREIHKGLPYKTFTRPSSGIIDVTVCAKSGLLRTSACNQGEVTLPFLEGTQPVQYCEMHGGGANPFPSRMPFTSIPLGGGVNFDEGAFLDSLPMPKLPIDLLPELQGTQSNKNQNNQRNTPNRGNTSSQNQTLNNPFLDGNSTQSQNPKKEPSKFPDEVIPFVPPKQEDNEDDDDELPSWNPLE